MFIATGNDYSQAYKTGYPAYDEQKMGFVIARTVVSGFRAGAKRFYGRGSRPVKFPAVKTSERRR